LFIDDFVVIFFNFVFVFLFIVILLASGLVLFSFYDL